MKAITKNNEYYIKNDVTYDRITNVIGILKNDAYENISKIMGEYKADEVFKNAGTRGTQFHEFAALYAKKKLSDKVIEGLSYMSKDIYKRILLYKEWFNKNVKKSILVEKTILDEKLKVGTTIDLYVILNTGKSALIELKTSAGIYNSHIIQVGIQEKILINNKKLCPDEVYVLQVKDKVKLKYVPKIKRELGYKYFLMLLQLKRGLNNLL